MRTPLPEVPGLPARCVCEPRACVGGGGGAIPQVIAVIVLIHVCDRASGDVRHTFLRVQNVTRAAEATAQEPVSGTARPPRWWWETDQGVGSWETATARSSSLVTGCLDRPQLEAVPTREESLARCGVLFPPSLTVAYSVRFAAPHTGRIAYLECKDRVGLENTTAQLLPAGAPSVVDLGFTLWI